MKFAFALLAAAGLAAAAPQAVTAYLTPSGTAPAGCVATYPGNFEITVVQPSNAKRDLAKRQVSSCGQPGILTLNLANGQLHDVDGRTGYIAGENRQFQFDKPVQAGGVITAGFTVCQNGSIALGPTTTFYQCKSGDFYNLYDQYVNNNCEAVNIDIIPCDGSSAQKPAGGPAPVSAYTDGQPQGTAKATAVPISVFSDGQPQATAAATMKAPVPVSEFTDGQPQATANATVKVTPTIMPAAGAISGANGALFAGVAVVAAALL